MNSNRTTDQREILATNGLGSYSLCGVNGQSFRKYHGLLTVALNPPVNRVHLIGEFLIKSPDEMGGAVTLCPDTAAAMPYPIATETWNFNDKRLKVTRERAFKYGQQLLGLSYTFNSEMDQQLHLVPLFNIRDHHDTLPSVESDYGFGYRADTGELKVSHPLAGAKIKSTCPFVMGVVAREAQHYEIETERGYPDRENHIEPGYYSVSLSAGQTTTVDFLLAYDGNLEQVDVASIFSEAKERADTLKGLASGIPAPFEPLIYAADQFIAHRSTTNKASILAGYPWFTDWGRDTMIAIPGLCLATGRPELALEMIETFLSHAQGGIIPNNFPDHGEAPMYNTVDGTLWLFQAFYAYWLETKNAEALERLYPVLKEIVKYHQEGTINKIFVDTDGLLSSGDPTTQLTWMDVKVDGWVVTPRHGKAVEINALYYNALKIMSTFAALLKSEADAHAYSSTAEALQSVFHQVFWNSEKGYLNDLWMDGQVHSMIRPNMLFAISLPFPILEKAYWKAVVDVCQGELYFDYGLRSLSSKDCEYVGVYQGDLLARDGAYHRGTGWGWLLGPFLEAHYKVYGDRLWVENALKKALTHLEEGALGTYAENFDGDAPHSPRGCCAQAWSVSEVLRLTALISS